MCEFETHVMLCAHPCYTLKAPCHDKRNYEQCFGQNIYHESDVYYQEYPCDRCAAWYSVQSPEVQAARIPLWQARQQQYRADTEAAKQRTERQQVEEKKQVDEMLKKGGRGGGSGSGSRSGGSWSDREVKKPYGR